MSISRFELQESTNHVVHQLEGSVELLKANLLLSKSDTQDNDAIEIFNREMANIIVRCGQFLGGMPDIAPF